MFLVKYVMATGNDSVMPGREMPGGRGSLAHFEAVTMFSQKGLPVIRQLSLSCM
jgi:hypothetical protein